MENVYDFYKPDLSSEFPEVDGPLSIECYLRSVDQCYRRYMEKLERKEGLTKAGLKDFDYWCFHSPYTKLVQKSYGRLVGGDLLLVTSHLFFSRSSSTSPTSKAFNDFLRGSSKSSEAENLQPFRDLKLEETYFNKEVEKTFVSTVSEEYNQKVIPALYMAKNVGNMYCGSLYGGLVSLVSHIASDDLVRCCSIGTSSIHCSL